MYLQPIKNSDMADVTIALRTYTRTYISIFHTQWFTSVIRNCITKVLWSSLSHDEDIESATLERETGRRGSADSKILTNPWDLPWRSRRVDNKVVHLPLTLPLMNVQTKRKGEQVKRKGLRPISSDLRAMTGIWKAYGFRFLFIAKRRVKQGPVNDSAFNG